MEIVIAIVGFIVGLVAGFIGTYLLMNALNVGHLRIDRSIPEDNPYLFLDLSKDVDAISKKPYVTFKVVNKDFISHI